jgi:vancomycin resistance protein YoaR
VPDTELTKGEETPIEAGARHRGATHERFVSRYRVWIVIAGLAAVLACAVVADVAFSWGRVHPGVRMAGVSVGSMMPDTARVALSDAFARSESSTVNVTWEGRDFPVTAAQLGVALDTTASLDAAMAVGRAGSLPEVIYERIVATFSGIDVAPRMSTDPTATSLALDAIAAEVGDPPVDASVSVSGTALKVAPSHTGRALDRDATGRALVAAFARGERTVPAVVVAAAPAVSDAEAQRAADSATALISGPVHISFESRSLDVPRETVASWLVFVQAGTPGGGSGTASGALTPSFDTTRVADSVFLLTNGLGRPAKNASFAADHGPVRVVPGQVGLAADVGALATGLVASCAPGGSRSVVLTMKETQPALTTEAAKEMGISDRISTFTTSYSTANPARTNNVHLLAKAFNGKLVAPGAVFSFNGTAGQRTAAKGYQEAPAIVKGKLVPQLGGGVCQVGTTFFNTVFFSGLPIIERHNHSFYISHYPTGRDATVSWGGPDFKFKNDTKGWILIRTAVTASTLTISLYGTDPGYDVQYTTGPFTDVVPHGVQVVKDAKLPVGRRVVEDPGVDGRTVVVKRTVYLAGVLVRQDSFVSHYNPKIEVVRVGTKPSTTPSSTPSP